MGKRQRKRTGRTSFVQSGKCSVQTKQENLRKVAPEVENGEEKESTTKRAEKQVIIINKEVDQGLVEQ